MSITTESELIGMKQISEVVGTTLKLMREYAKVGISTKELDEFGGKILKSYGAKSAPYETYEFPGYTCISVNEEAAHGRSEEHTSELQSRPHISYAVFCLKKQIASDTALLWD